MMMYNSTKHLSCLYNTHFTAIIPDYSHVFLVPCQFIYFDHVLRCHVIEFSRDYIKKECETSAIAGYQCFNYKRRFSILLFYREWQEHCPAFPDHELLF